MKKQEIETKKNAKKGKKDELIKKLPRLSYFNMQTIRVLTPEESKYLMPFVNTKI
jgi:hypothetical protein